MEKQKSICRINRLLACLLAVVMVVTGVNWMPIKVGAATNTYKERLSVPEKTDYHYYSSNNPFYPDYGMPNCTVYAWGKAYELLGQKPNLL